MSSLDPNEKFRWRYGGLVSTAPLGYWQGLNAWEWRRIGDLPGEGGGKGDREAFIAAYRAAEGQQWSYVVWDDRHFDFLESDAGHSAVLALWGEKDSLASEVAPLKERIAELEKEAAERDAAEELAERARPNRHHELNDYDMALRAIRTFTKDAHGSLTWSVQRVIQRLTTAESRLSSQDAESEKGETISENFARLAEGNITEARESFAVITGVLLAHEARRERDAAF